MSQPGRVARGRRRALSLAVTALFSIGTTGCSMIGGIGDSDTMDTSDGATTQLQSQFAELPGVNTATVRYQDNLTVGAQLRASVEVEPGTDATARLDAIEQACWLSDVNPLLELDFVLATLTERPTGETRTYDLEDDADVSELTERGGGVPMDVVKPWESVAAGRWWRCGAWRAGRRRGGGLGR